MGFEDKKAAMDGVAWLMNVGTSVFIVFVNKVLMDPNNGYKFSFGEHAVLSARCTPHTGLPPIQITMPPPQCSSRVPCSHHAVRFPLPGVCCQCVGCAACRSYAERLDPMGR